MSLKGQRSSLAQFDFLKTQNLESFAVQFVDQYYYFTLSYRNKYTTLFSSPCMSSLYYVMNLWAFFKKLAFLLQQWPPTWWWWHLNIDMERIGMCLHMPKLKDLRLFFLHTLTLAAICSFTRSSSAATSGSRVPSFSGSGGTEETQLEQPPPEPQFVNSRLVMKTKLGD